jgi:hypothetical protein
MWIALLSFMQMVGSSSQPSGQQEDQNDQKQDPADSGRPVAVGVVSEVGESTKDNQKQNDQ